MNGKTKQIKEKTMFYYARNHVMSTNKVFDDKDEALSYIGSAGTVETYKLDENYYYFIEDTIIGHNKCMGKHATIPKFGAVLPGGRIHMNHAKWLLGV
jgi:hypothetical protein